MSTLITALPAAAAVVAAGAYTNAKLRLSTDYHFLSSYTKGLRDFNKRLDAGKANLFYKLEEHASNPKIANEIFLIFEGKSWTFKQYYTLVLKYAGWLHKVHNVVAGEIVALDFMNCPSFLFLVTALWSLGASPAMINCNITSKSLIHCIKVSNARLLILDPEVASKVLSEEVNTAVSAPNFRNNAFPLEVAILTEGLEKSMNYFPSYRAPDAVRKIERSSMAMLMYTSGTTGFPKAATITWGKVCVGGHLTALLLELQAVDRRSPDRFYTSMPLYHTTAFTLGFNACYQSATSLVISRKFSVSKFWQEVKSTRTTVIQYVGETLRYLLATPPSPEDKQHQVRMAFGNGLRPDVWKRFKTRFGIETIVEVYGATEGVSATWNFNRNDFTDGAIASYGKITEYIASKNQAVVKVDWETEAPWRDPKTGLCERVPRGEVGELLFVLNAQEISETFAGYYNNQNATNSKVIRDVLKKGDAYFRSGDTVRFDKEGRVWFSDRIGDTFRWKSENVSTAEVGEVLGHHKAVQEANVYGVKVPGYEGRAGCAALLLQSSALKSLNTPTDDILESLATYSANSLPKYAVPLFLRIVRELELTGNNKQQKGLLRNQGVNLEIIRNSNSNDKLYWLKPGAQRYVEFTARDLQALEKGQVRL